MASPRRIGAPDAKNRGVLLDAAEHLMLEEGYAAVTSRKVADKAGLKHQLVHYYFRGMEELFEAMFRRRAEEGLALQAEVLNSPQPLWAIWKWATDPSSVAFWTEFAALANHRKALSAVIAYYGERFRDEERKAISAALARYGVAESEVPAIVWTVFSTSVSRMLVMEQALGITDGHSETVEFCERFIRRLEGDPLPPEELARTVSAHQ
jgi:AcrR family transcriptional regulator